MGSYGGEQQQWPEDDLGPLLLGSIWMMTGVSGAVIALRYWCKISHGRGLWYDDYWLVAAWVALLLLAGFNTGSVAYDFGKHSWQVNWQEGPKLLLRMHMSGSFSIIACAWSKTSFAFTLLRICELPSQRYIVWFLIVTVNLGLGGAVLVTWIQCSPVKRVYDSNVPGTCWKPIVQQRYNITVTVWSGLMDIVLALMPWWIIWKVNMTLKEKLGVLTAMSMGIFAGIISFLKIPSLAGIGGDDLIQTVPLVIWGAAESAVTILAASIPVLRLLLPRRDRHVNELDYKSNGSSNTYNTFSQKRHDLESHDAGAFELLETDKVASPLHTNFNKKRDNVRGTPYRGEDIDSIQEGLNGAIAFQQSMMRRAEVEYATWDKDLPSLPSRSSLASTKPGSIRRKT